MLIGAGQLLYYDCVWLAIDTQVATEGLIFIFAIMMNFLPLLNP